MTPLDICRQHFPGISEDDAAELLLAGTSWPMGTDDKVDAQIREAIANSDGTIQGVIAYAHEQIEKAVNKYKEKQ